MDINISDSLKKLRKDKGNTQEELAGFLGISIQAISKWERGERYPDITLLPKIAAYYNVTVDDLLGVGETQKKERKDKILEQFNYNLQKGNINANIELMRAAIEEFPNDYTIMSDLQFALYFSNKEEYYDEVIELGEKIINNCTDDDLRYGAIQILCFTYEQHGKEEIAKEYARKLPIYAVTQNEVLAGILKGEDLLRLAQNNLTYLVQAIHNNIIAVLRSVENTDDEKLYMYRKIIQFYD